MKEEKSMIEYKEPKGILNWLKSKFEKLKDKFKPNKSIKESTNDSKKEKELVEEDAEFKFEIHTMDDVMRIIGEKPKSWELTEEQLDEVKAGYPNEVPQKNEKIEEQELSEEDLDKITAGYPLNNDEHEK